MMQTVMNSLLVITCFAFPVGTTQANPRPHDDLPSGHGKLLGKVVDAEESAPVGRAFLLVYSEEGRGQKIINVDKKGTFELDLAPGFYDILAGAVEFVPSCKRVEVVSGTVSRFDPKLKADVEHLEQQSKKK
jgi:hypothetical protein